MNKEFGAKFKVSDDFWNKISELIKVLEIPYRITIESQNVVYSLSDFYISWIRLQKGLKRLDTEDKHFNLASNLIKRLNERAPSLFKTPLMLCAIYLDPRINFKLCITQKRGAAMDLIKIHERFTELASENNQNVINDTLDEIQAEYCNQAGVQRDRETSALLTSLTNFEAEKCDIRDSVKSFWKKKWTQISTYSSLGTYDTFCWSQPMYHKIVVLSILLLTERTSSSYGPQKLI